MQYENLRRTFSVSVSQYVDNKNKKIDQMTNASR